MNPAPHRPRRGVVRRGGPAPAGVRPGDLVGAHARGVQEVLPGVPGRRMVPPRTAARARRHPGSAVVALGDRRADPRRQPGGVDVRERLRHGARAVAAGHARAEAVRADRDRPQVDLDDGADRARRGLGRRRRARPRDPAAGRHLAHRGRQALHHQRRARHGREHLPPGAGPGTKGLSMFLVPKFLVGPDGELGERNGVYATNVEHKMGLKASTTCELTFGGNRPAVGTLVGDVHDGIRQMFVIIEFARMMVGTKAIATLSAGYLTALDFAKTRVQGADLTQFADKTAPRVTIIHHPDVRRLLMLQKAYVEGMRALVLYTSTFQDTTQAAEAEGSNDELASALNDLLLPVVKGVGSERAYEMLTHSLQTLGGSGFLQDYPIEQYVRDAKIDSLYEGTTAIQGMDLYFRKIVRNEGRALGYVLGQVREFAAAEAGNGRLKAERAALATAADDVEAMVAAMHGFLGASMQQPPEIYRVGLNTTRLLLALGDLIIGWLLARQAEIAQARLDEGAAGADRAFYEGKIGAARFFAATVLPRLATERQLTEATTLDLMDLPEEAF